MLEIIIISITCYMGMAGLILSVATYVDHPRHIKSHPRYAINLWEVALWPIGACIWISRVNKRVR